MTINLAGIIQVLQAHDEILVTPTPRAAAPLIQHAIVAGCRCPFESFMTIPLTVPEMLPRFTDH